MPSQELNLECGWYSADELIEEQACYEPICSINYPYWLPDLNIGFFLFNSSWLTASLGRPVMVAKPFNLRNCTCAAWFFWPVDRLASSFAPVRAVDSRRSRSVTLSKPGRHFIASIDWWTRSFSLFVAGEWKWQSQSACQRTGQSSPAPPLPQWHRTLNEFHLKTYQTSRYCQKTLLVSKWQCPCTVAALSFQPLTRHTPHWHDPCRSIKLTNISSISCEAGGHPAPSRLSCTAGLQNPCFVLAGTDPLSPSTTWLIVHQCPSSMEQNEHLACLSFADGSVAFNFMTIVCW